MVGPHRVFPGRLSVSRTFGDVEAKMSCFGGLKNVIIAVPEISVFKIKEDVDFLFLGCDGIYDQLSNSDIVDCVWMTLKDGIKSNNIHNQCSLCVDMIIKSSLVRKTIDNVTGIFIAFENFEKNLTGHTTCNNQLLTSIELNSEKSFSPNFSIKESPDKKLKPQESFKNFISNYESNDKIFYENLKSFESFESPKYAPPYLRYGSSTLSRATVPSSPFNSANLAEPPRILYCGNSLTSSSVTTLAAAPI